MRQEEVGGAKAAALIYVTQKSSRSSEVCCSVVQSSIDGSVQAFDTCSLHAAHALMDHTRTPSQCGSCCYFLVVVV